MVCRIQQEALKWNIDPDAVLEKLRERLPLKIMMEIKIHASVKRKQLPWCDGCVAIYNCAAREIKDILPKTQKKQLNAILKNLDI